MSGPGLPAEVCAVADYAGLARQRLDPRAWAYLDGAAADELTRRWNREAFDQLPLRPRVLQPLGEGHLRQVLFGHELASPLLLAPVAWQRLFHPDGESAAAAAAAALGVGFVLSTLASQTLEEVAAVAAQHGSGPRWFQLYFQPERALNQALLQRAEAAGYTAIVLTVDAPIAGVRNREQRAGFQLPPGIRAVNLPDDAATPLAGPGGQAVFAGWMRRAPTWADLEWLVGATRLPVLVKGILDPDDAVQAMAAGAAGVIVSNHGGRTLDTLPASLDALPAIAARLGGRIPLLLDGGIQRGSDVFKALALGASGVLIGRAFVQALAVAGAMGVAHVLRLLEDELAATMALTGCARLADIGPDRLFPVGGRWSLRTTFI